MSLKKWSSLHAEDDNLPGIQKDDNLGFVQKTQDDLFFSETRTCINVVH